MEAKIAPSCGSGANSMCGGEFDFPYPICFLKQANLFSPLEHNGRHLP